MSSSEELAVVALVLYVIGLPFFVNWFEDFWNRKVNE